MTYWLQLLYDNLSKLFSRVVSSNTYKAISAIANELNNIANVSDEVKTQINITTATGASLDKHALQFGLTRLPNETDEELRSRLLKSFTQTQLTKPNFIKLGKDMIPNYEVVVREPVYDRWFLDEVGTSKVLHIETVQAVDTTTIVVSGNIYELYAVWCNGENFASTYTYTLSGSNTIILTTPLSIAVTYGHGYTYGQNRIYGATISSTPTVEVWYYSLPTVTKLAKSWLGLNTFIYPINLNDNLTVLEQTTTSIKWQSVSLAETKVNILYFNEINKLTYNWETVVDKDKCITINNQVKINNQVPDEIKYATTVTTIETNYPIVNLTKIYRVTDITEEVNYANFATFSGNTITLTTPLPNAYEKLRITYIREETVPLDYLQLPISNFLLTGMDDPKNTAEVYVKTDNIDTPEILSFFNIIRKNATGGVKLWLSNIPIGTLYESFKYNYNKYME